LSFCIIRQHRKQTHATGVRRPAEQRRDARPAFTGLQHLLAEISQTHAGNFRGRHNIAIAEKG